MKDKAFLLLAFISAAVILFVDLNSAGLMIFAALTAVGVVGFIATVLRDRSHTTAS